jgi:choline dehydrogenase-like flavoprotein
VQLFPVDRAVNPTLTIIANALRVGDHIAKVSAPDIAIAETQSSNRVSRLHP